MSAAYRFSLLGDSNVSRHVNKNSCRASPFVKACQVIRCGRMEVFASSLESVRSESNVCIVSCITNFIAGTGSEGPSSVSHRVDPVLQEVRAALHAACESNQATRYMLAPPMYRTSPLWYREGLPEILNLFSQTMNYEKAKNIHLLPNFPTPYYDQGGIHLTPYSGLEFILHLFDGSQEVLESLSLSIEGATDKGKESTRLLEDRVVALEQDHRRLNRVVDDKIAIDAEFADFAKNERFEDTFVIEGTPRIPDTVFGKAWQDQAVRNVQDVLKILIGRPGNIVFVQNATTKQPDAVVAYNVKVTSVAESKTIRDKFGSFFLGGTDKRPEELKPYSIKNRLTPETKIRISVLKLLAKRYRDSNPGSKVQVIGYDTRPLIKITPPASASDRRVQVYNYIEAVKTLPTNFTPAEVSPIIRRINPRLVGQIKAIFIVLSDDLYKQRGPKPRGPPVRPQPSADAAEAAASSNESGSDMEEDSRQSPVISQPSGSHSSRHPKPVVPQPTGKGSSGHRSHICGASSELTRSAKK